MNLFFKNMIENASPIAMLRDEEGDKDAGAGAATDTTGADSQDGGDSGPSGADTQANTDTGNDGGQGGEGDQQADTDTKAGDGEQPKDKTDWRRDMAGDDDKFYEYLQRFAAPSDVGKSLQEQRKQISKMPKQLGENPTDEEIAAYRKSHNIPEKPEGYEESLKLPEGTVLGEADKPIIEDFFKFAHEKNWTPAQVNDAANWYFATEQSREAVMQEQLNQLEVTARTELREAWGNDYETNNGIIEAWFSRQPEVVKQHLQDSFKYNPEFAKWLANYVRENEPSATIIQDAEMTGVSIDDEIKKIQKIIRETPEVYEKDKEMQKRMSQLSTIKRKQRAA